MIELTTDIEMFRKFWMDEKENAPPFIASGTGAWHRSEEEFIDFCQSCERIYNINNVALLYVENMNGNADIHFSILRGQSVSVGDLRIIRDMLLEDYRMIFGWVGSKNRGLKKLLTSCQLRWYGFSMYKGHLRNRILEWHCYSLSREQFQASNTA